MTGRQGSAWGGEEHGSWRDSPRALPSQRLGMVTEAVDLALSNGRLDLAKHSADSVRPDTPAEKALRKDLWLRIAKHVVSGGDAARTGASGSQTGLDGSSEVSARVREVLALLAESKGPGEAPTGLGPNGNPRASRKPRGPSGWGVGRGCGAGRGCKWFRPMRHASRRAGPSGEGPLLELEDLLMLFPDFTLIDDFKEPVCAALAAYGERMQATRRARLRTA